MSDGAGQHGQMHRSADRDRRPGTALRQAKTIHALRAAENVLRFAMLTPFSLGKNPP